MEMNKELTDFITKEMRFSSHKKYHKYIEEYINNLTEIQVQYWQAWKDGKLTIH